MCLITNELNKLTFILVDDDEEDRMLVRMVINDIGSFPVVEFSDGKELLDYLHEESEKEQSQEVIRLVLMDVNMPLVKGPDAVRIMRQYPLWNEVPILIMSTSDDPYQIEEAFKAGANSYFVKPPSYTGMIEQLRQILDEWVEKWLPRKNN